MAKYIKIQVVAKDDALPFEERMRVIKQQGKFALHKRYREQDRGVYSITCLQTGTVILSHLKGKKYALLCLEQIAGRFLDFDVENEGHKNEIWRYMKENYYRKEIFG